MVRGVVLNIIFLFISWGIFAQNEFVTLEIEPKTVEVGQEIIITVKTNINGPIHLNLPDEFIESGMRQSGMQSSVEFINGKQRIMNYSFQIQSGYFTKEGQYLFGPVKVQSNKKEYKSDSYTVKVVKAQNMISDDPSRNMDKAVFGIIEQSKKTIYEGEPVVLEGKIYSQVEIIQIENYTPFALDGPADIRDLDKSNQVTSSIEMIGGKRIQTFKIGKQLMFPEKIGEVTINPFQIILAYFDYGSFFTERTRIISNASTITVKPLPEGMPNEFIDAVGKFSVTANISNPNIEQGDVIELKVKVKGRGNLHNIKQPHIELPKNLSFYGDPEIEDEISYSSIGAEGTKTFKYFIQVNTTGNIQLEPIKIAYFNPSTERYEFSESKLQMIQVTPTDASVVKLEREEDINLTDESELRPYISEYITPTTETSWLTGSRGALLLFSPIMLGFILGMATRTKKKVEEKSALSKAKSLYKSSVLESLEGFKNYMNDEDSLSDLSNVFLDYFAKRYGRERGEITRGFLQLKVPHDIPEDTYSKIVSILDELDFAKYSRGYANQSMNHIVEDIKQVINSLG